MKKLVRLIFCAVALVGAFPAGVLAQTIAGQNAGGSAPSVLTALAAPVPGHAWLGASGANHGLGYEDSFSSAGYTNIFWVDSWDGNWIIDGRGHISQQRGNFFGNLGFLRSTFFEPMNSDVRVGFWYDWDGDEAPIFGHSFNQLGVSFDVLGPQYDFRVNGYVPIGEANYHMGSTGPLECFVGNRLLVQHGIDSALRGFDSEIGIRPGFGEAWQAVLDLGGYYYQSKLVPAFGGFRARVSVQPAPMLTGMFEVNHDNRFKTTGFLGLQLHFGGGSAGRGGSPSGRGLELTKRNAHVVRFHQDPIYAVNPITGAPWNVFHVNNTNTAGAMTGAAEDPFATLAAAEAASAENDMIFVHVGDGTTTGMDAGIALQDGQFLLGDGVPHLVPDANFGLVRVCSNTTGIRPTITNPNGPAVTLASRNTVAGFNIVDAREGIVGNGIDSADIRDNEILGQFNFGVRISNSTGTFNVANNQIGNPTDLVNTNNNVGAAFDAVRFEDTFGEFSIDTNTIESAGGVGVHFLNSTGNAEFIDNTLVGNGIGFRLAQSTPGLGVLNALMEGNTIHGVTTVPNAVTSSMTVNPNGIGIAVFAAGAGNVIDLIGGVRNNVIGGNTGDGLILSANNGATVRALIEENIIGAQVVTVFDGLGNLVSATRTTDGNGLVSGVGIRLMGDGDAINPTSNLLVDILNNQVAGNLGETDGTAASLYASVTGNSTAVLNIMDNNFDTLEGGVIAPVPSPAAFGQRFNPGVRLDFDTTNASVNLLRLERNFIMFNNGDGLEINVPGLNGGVTRLGALLDSNFIAANIDVNGLGNGIDINVSGASITEFQVVNHGIPQVDAFGIPIATPFNGINAIAASLTGFGGTMVLDMRNNDFIQGLNGGAALLEVGSNEGVPDGAGTVGSMFALVDFNTFQANANAPPPPPPPEFIAIMDATAIAGSELCLELAGNSSNTPYTLTNNSVAAFNLDDRGDNAPPVFATSGGITAVAPGTCAASAAPFRLIP